MALFTLKQVAFKNIIQYPDLEIEEKKLTFICGKSGTGKSTLFKMFNGTVSPDSGSIFYQNKPLYEYDAISLRREILLVSQTVFLFDKTIQENFDEFYSYLNLKTTDRNRIEEYLKICCACFPLDTMCNYLSGGERQRVFISICLSLLPKVLLLDEPTSALDECNSEILIKNIKNFCFQKGITPIIISHHRGLAKEYADHIIELGG